MMLGLVRRGRVLLLCAQRSGRIVGTALLHFSADDEMRCGLYWVSTIPEARRAGVAGRLTQHAISLARDAGRTRLVLQSSSMAVPLYLQLGFQAGLEAATWIVGAQSTS
jgi:GNAT superfamily N-acetyltransferase